MNINRTLFLLVFTITLVFGAACSATEEEQPNKPNILLILADDLGYNDLGFQGSTELKTPNLDNLAKNGVIFTNAYVTASVCSPSRAGIITGKYQQFFGHEANIPPPNLGTDTTMVTMADVLQENGYRTGINGKCILATTTIIIPIAVGLIIFGVFLADTEVIFLKIIHLKITRQFTPTEIIHRLKVNI